MSSQKYLIFSQEKLYEMGAGSWFIKYIHPEDRIGKLTIKNLKDKNRRKNVRIITDSNIIKHISGRSEIKKFNKKLCIIVSIEDITDHTKLIDQLDNLQFILDSVPASVELLDLERDVVLYSNDRVEEVFGYSNEQVADWDFWLNNIVHPGDREEQLAYEENDCFPLSRIYRIIKPDGKVYRLKNNHLIKEYQGRKYRIVTNSILNCENE